MSLIANFRTLFVRCLFGASWLGLAGCASNGGSGGASSVQWRSQAIAACAQKLGRADLLVLDVPAATSALANKMMVMSLAVSGSNSVDELVGALTRPQSHGLVVSGSHSEVTAATLRSAFEQLASKQQRTTATVCFVGNASDLPSLQAAGQAVGATVVAGQAQ